MFAVLDELQRAIEKASASEHLLDLPRLRKLIDQLDAVWLHQVRAAERAGMLNDMHAAPAGVLAHTCRLTRTVPAPLWRALVARDQHCTEPGCTMPAAYCDAHHITHWADGGPTNLDNLELTCWRHHRQHHEGHSRAGP